MTVEWPVDSCPNTTKAGSIMVPEAPMEDAPGGKRPAGEGWFVLNAREAAWIHNEKFGAGVDLRGDAATSRTTGSTSR